MDGRVLMKGLSRRGFLLGTVSAAGAVGVVGTFAAPRLERTHVDSGLALAPEYPIERAERPPVRGHRGLSKAWPAATWRLYVSLGGVASTVFSRDDLARFEFVEHVTEFRGKEGSAVVHWGGVRLADVLRAVAGPDRFSWINASTPDGSHTVTLSGEVAVHPQTLLATHMGGESLDPDHGAQLRIVVPVRPAADSLKRVARIVVER